MNYCNVFGIFLDNWLVYGKLFDTEIANKSCHVWKNETENINKREKFS